MRFVLQSVSDVVATPIDPAVYFSSKRRNVSDEERMIWRASLLAGGCEDGNTSLIPSHQEPERAFIISTPGVPFPILASLMSMPGLKMCGVASCFACGTNHAPSSA